MGGGKEKLEIMNMDSSFETFICKESNEKGWSLDKAVF